MGTSKVRLAMRGWRAAVSSHQPSAVSLEDSTVRRSTSRGQSASLNFEIPSRSKRNVPKGPAVVGVRTIARPSQIQARTGHPRERKGTSARALGRRNLESEDRLRYPVLIFRGSKLDLRFG